MEPDIIVASIIACYLLHLFVSQIGLSQLLKKAWQTTCRDSQLKPRL